MTIDEAMRIASAEYTEECERMNADHAYGALGAECMRAEYDEIDEELPGYVGDILRAHGWQAGRIVPNEVYQLARMCFRMGMRVQRKLDHPEEKTSLFWRSDRQAV